MIAVPFLPFVYFFRVIDKDKYYYQLKMEKRKKKSDMYCPRKGIVMNKSVPYAGQ